MFAVLLTVTLVFDPIPKKPDEGRIAILVSKDAKREIVILTPSGQVENTIDLKEIPEPVRSVKLCRDAKTALLLTSNKENIQVGFRGFPSSTGYLIDITSTNKPRKLIDRRGSFSWVINRDGSKAYCTFLDVEETAKLGASDPALFQSQIIDLKTGETKRYDLPSHHQIVDLTGDDTTLLTSAFVDKQYRAALVPTKTGKPELIANQEFYPLSISPDGKRILTYDFAENATKRAQEFIVYEMNSRMKNAISMTQSDMSANSYSYGADGKRICFVNLIHSDNSAVYKLFTVNIDGTKQKMIYEAKPGVFLSDCDWR